MNKSQHNRGWNRSFLMCLGIFFRNSSGSFLVLYPYSRQSMRTGAKRVWKSGCICCSGSFSLFSALGSYAIPGHSPWDESGSRHCSKRLWDYGALCSEQVLSSYRNVYGLIHLITLVFTMHWVCCWRKEVICWTDILLISFLTQKITLMLSELSDSDYTFPSRHLVPCAFYFIKELMCAWKQSLSAVFVVTKMKSENGWKKMEGVYVWLTLWVCWLAWVYGPMKCWQLKSWNWVPHVSSASHCVNWLLRYLLWNRWWIVTKHGCRHRYLILFR